MFIAIVFFFDLGCMPELDMGHFFVTQSDPTQDFPDPTRPDP